MKICIERKWRSRLRILVLTGIILRVDAMAQITNDLLEIYPRVTIRKFFHQEYAEQGVCGLEIKRDNNIISSERFDAQGYVIYSKIFATRERTNEQYMCGRKVYSYSEDRNKIREDIFTKTDYMRDTLCAYNLYSFDSKGLLVNRTYCTHGDTIDNTENYSYDSLGRMTLHVRFSRKSGLVDTVYAVRSNKQGCLYGDYGDKSKVGWKKCYDSRNRIIASSISGDGGTTRSRFTYQKRVIEICSDTENPLPRGTGEEDHQKQVLYIDAKTGNLKKVELSRQSATGVYTVYKTITYFYDKDSDLLMATSDGDIYEYSFCDRTKK